MSHRTVRAHDYVVIHGDRACNFYCLASFDVLQHFGNPLSVGQPHAVIVGVIATFATSTEILVVSFLVLHKALVVDRSVGDDDLPAWSARAVKRLLMDCGCLEVADK